MQHEGPGSGARRVLTSIFLYLIADLNILDFGKPGTIARNWKCALGRARSGAPGRPSVSAARRRVARRRLPAGSARFCLLRDAPQHPPLDARGVALRSGAAGATTTRVRYCSQPRIGRGNGVCVQILVRSRPSYGSANAASVSVATIATYCLPFRPR
jgi:hypothetical protein